MVIEASTAVFFGLIEIPVVAAAVKHRCKGRCLRHPFLRRHMYRRDMNLLSGGVTQKAFYTQDGFALGKTNKQANQYYSLGHWHRVIRIALPCSLCNSPLKALITAYHNCQALLLYLGISLLSYR